MDQKSVKKTNVIYLLLTILVPIVFIGVMGYIGATFFRDGGPGAVIFLMAPTALSVAWWILGPTTI